LRLPLGVSENELREVLKECSSNLHAGYLKRAERSAIEWPVRCGDNLPPSYHSSQHDERARLNGASGGENFDFHDTVTLIR
jgi:hypothetical protein